MVYYGRRKTTFRRFGKYAKRKTFRKFKKTGSGMRVLASKVKSLQKEMRRKRQTLWLRNDGNNLTAEIAQPYTSMSLCKFSQDQPIFGTDPNDLLGAKVLLKSITIKSDIKLEGPNNEEETQNIEVFVVQLKDRANDILDESAGTLSLTADVHYYRYGGTGSMITFMNKKYFNVLAHKRMTLTNYTSPLTTAGAQNLDGTNQRFDFKLKINKVIDANMSNVADQSWKTLNCPRDPSMNYFVLWFNDNATADTESPVVNMIALKKFEKLDN